MRLWLLVAFGAAVLVSVSCGGVVSPSDNVTETFSGTLQPLGIAFHSFTTTKSGEIEVKITALAPVTNVFLGTFYGQPMAGGACGYNYFRPPNEFSMLNQVSIIGEIHSGPWCVGIYDPLPGHLSTAADYTLTVKHP